MNTFEQGPINNELDQKIVLTEDSINNLDTIWRWASFFSILGFIMIAFLVIFGIIMGFVASAFNNSATSPFVMYAIMIFYFIFAAIYFYPILLLFRFSSWTKKAIGNKSSLDFSLALKNLKGHFQYVGIMTIVLFAVYILIIIGFVLVKVMV
jgi:hypothetical protein